MRPIATDVARSVVCVSVYVFLGNTGEPLPETIEPIKVPFRVGRLIWTQRKFTGYRSPSTDSLGNI